MKYISQFFASVVTGALGGWILGFLILSFGFFIGRSGNQGGPNDANEGFGYWDPFTTLGLAFFYGMPLGIILFPIGYFLFLRKVSVFRALLMPAAGTLIGGLIGAVFEPPVAALVGIIGFFVSCGIAAQMKGEESQLG